MPTCQNVLSGLAILYNSGDGRTTDITLTNDGSSRMLTSVTHQEDLEAVWTTFELSRWSVHYPSQQHHD